jgi:hypothetical protein
LTNFRSRKASRAARITSRRGAPRRSAATRQSSYSGEAAATAAPAPGPEGDSGRVGAFLNGEEWWEVPLGAAFILASVYTVYHFGWQND